MDQNTIQDLEVYLLLETLRLRHGYDFRNFSKRSMIRRIKQSLTDLDVVSIADLIPPLLHDATFPTRFISALTVTVSTLFRDPLAFLFFRRQVLPMLRSYPFLNIWIAGCASGEEAYAMAILLREEQLHERTQIYATDIDVMALHTAEAGLYPVSSLDTFTDNYRQAGGMRQFSDYCQIKNDMIQMSPTLKQNILFTGHNLVSDAVFAEMHVVLCRNVLIYFDRALQNRVLNLFHESLVRGGFLCLGDKETLDFLDVVDHFVPLSDAHPIYQQRVDSGQKHLTRAPFKEEKT